MQSIERDQTWYFSENVVFQFLPVTHKNSSIKFPHSTFNMVVTSYKQYLICCVQKSSVLNVIVDLKQKFTDGWYLIKFLHKEMIANQILSLNLLFFFYFVRDFINDFIPNLFLCIFCAITCRNACNRVYQNQTNCAVLIILNS